MTKKNKTPDGAAAGVSSSTQLLGFGFSLSMRLREECELIEECETYRLLEEAADAMDQMRDAVINYESARVALRKAEEGSEEERQAISHCASMYQTMLLICEA